MLKGKVSTSIQNKVHVDLVLENPSWIKYNKARRPWFSYGT